MTSTSEDEYISTTECIKKILKNKNLFYELFEKKKKLKNRDNE